MIDHNLLQNTVQDIIYKAKHISRGSISETILLYGKKKNYICKQPIMHILQNQKISDIISQYKISHIMYQNSFSVNKVKSYGVFETGQICYHIQDFVDGTNIDILEYTTTHVIKIAIHLSQIHKIPCPIGHNQKVYYKSLRELYIGKQGIQRYINEQNLKNNNLCISLMKEYKILYTKIINQYPNRPCVYLHGDMSEYNIIFHKDNIFYIDFGNIIYGEAAIDVSIFWARLYISDLLSQSNHSTLFLNTYITNTKDHEIKDFLGLGLIYITCLLLGTDQLLSHQKTQFYNHILKYIYKK